jgi:hypothetical protein
LIAKGISIKISLQSIASAYTLAIPSCRSKYLPVTIDIGITVWQEINKSSSVAVFSDSETHLPPVVVEV